MSDGLYASSLHNNIISWEVSASIDGSYSASFSLSNEEGQYDAGLIPAIYSNDMHLLQRACALNWSPVEAYLDIKVVDISNAGGLTSLTTNDVATPSSNTAPSTIPTGSLQAGGARRHVFGLVEGHGRAESDRSNELSLDIISFSNRLRKKDLTDFVLTASTVKSAITQVLTDIATLHTSTWDVTNCPTEEYVGFIDGDNIIECCRKLAQVAGADVFTNEFGILVVEAWKDHTSSVDYTIPDALIRTVSKEVPIGDCPSQCTVSGKPKEDVDAPDETNDVTKESVGSPQGEQTDNCSDAGKDSSPQGDASATGAGTIAAEDGIPGTDLKKVDPITDRDSLADFMNTIQQGVSAVQEVGVPKMVINPYETVGRGQTSGVVYSQVREVPQKKVGLADRQIIEYENMIYAFGWGCLPGCGNIGSPGDGGFGIVWDKCMMEVMNGYDESKFLWLESEYSSPAHICPDGIKMLKDNVQNTTHLVAEDPNHPWIGRDDIHPGMAIQPFPYPFRLNGTVVITANDFAEGAGGDNRYSNGVKNFVQLHFLPFDPTTGSGKSDFLNHPANTTGQTTGCFVDCIGQGVHVYYTGWCQVLEVVNAINADARAQKLVVVSHGQEHDSSEWGCIEEHGGHFSDYPNAHTFSYTSDGSGFLPTTQNGLQYNATRLKALCSPSIPDFVTRGMGLSGDAGGFPNNYFHPTGFSGSKYFLDDPEPGIPGTPRTMTADIKSSGRINALVAMEETAPRQKVITGRDAWTIRNMNEILNKQNELADQLKSLEDKVQEEKQIEQGGGKKESPSAKAGGTSSAASGQSAQPSMSAETALEKTRESLRESQGIVQPVSGSGQKGGHEKDVGLQTHEDPTKIAATARDKFLRDEFGHVAVEVTNEFIATRAQCAKIAARTLQEAKMNRRRYSIDMVYSPKVGLNRVVRFNTPYSSEEVTGRVVSIGISYDKSPAATMSITVESFEDLGKTASTTNILGNPAMRQLDGRNWKSAATEALKTRVIGKTDFTFKDDGIDSSSTNFVNEGFIPGMWVSVEGATSRFNNSDKLIRSVTANNITWRVNDTGLLSGANDHNTSDATEGINIYLLDVPYYMKQDARIDGGYITLQTFDSTHRGHVLDATTSQPRGDAPKGTAELWQEIKLAAGFYRLLFNARDDMISGGFDNLEFRVEAVDGSPSNVLIDTWTHNDLYSDPRNPSSIKSRVNIPSTFTISSAEKYKLIFKTSRTGGFSSGVGNRIQISGVRLFTETTI